VNTPLLDVKGLQKVYTRGKLRRQETFSLQAEFSIEEPAIVGMMGPNGSGKTTLFELINGSNLPTAGEVRCLGKNIHKVKYDERDRLAIHYHQSYQVRHFSRTVPNFMLETAGIEYPMIHLFDEPQFNTQDGYIGFMLEFFQKLRREGRLVFVCLHPNEPFQLEIMREICERYIFVQHGKVSEVPDFESLISHNDAKTYLGSLLTQAA
jgi:ABC-type multidrug transport system ATPase subunit